MRRFCDNRRSQAFGIIPEFLMNWISLPTGFVAGSILLQSVWGASSSQASLGRLGAGRTEDGLELEAPATGPARSQAAPTDRCVKQTPGEPPFPPNPPELSLCRPRDGCLAWRRA